MHARYLRVDIFLMRLRAAGSTTKSDETQTEAKAQTPALTCAGRPGSVTVSISWGPRRGINQTDTLL